MKNRHAFRPGALDALERRLVLSGQVNSALLAPSVGRAATVEVARSPAPDRQVARFEVRWMREMIGHHDMAIRMARLALRNTENPGVRDLAHRIVSAQSREIGRMRGWLASWYGVRNARPVMGGDDAKMLRDLRSLRGDAFDRAFLEGMIGHHRAAIEDANELLGRAYHVPLRQLGTDVITTQTAEIAEMQAMLGEPGDMPHRGH